MRKRQKISQIETPNQQSMVSFFMRVSVSLSVVLVQLVLPIAPAFANEPGGAGEYSPAVISDVVDESTTSQESDESKAEDIPQKLDMVLTEVGSDTDTADAYVDDTASEEKEQAHAGAQEDAAPDSEISEIEPTVHSDDATSDNLDESESEVPEHLSPTVISETLEEESATSTTNDVEVADDPALLDETATSENSELPVVEIEDVATEENEDSDGVPTAPASDTETIEEIASTTENVVQVESHNVSSPQALTFATDECARVADGSFYCTPQPDDLSTYTNRVFAAPDSDGDTEIYLEKDGELHQLTHNQSDDAAPYYDTRSRTIVFHRLVDARYQIFTLDLTDGSEKQLTFDSYNNMQPTRDGDLIVWQGWVGNDWEIIMSENDEIRMLTDNVTHDIGPRINGEYVIWQAQNDEGWEVRVYNTLTGMTESIDESDGASIENPRLVLVYDAKHKNGDVETRGYDLGTRQNVALSSEAPNLPDKLPDPDQTGEERALITLTQQKTKTEDDDGESEPDISSPPDDEINETPYLSDNSDIVVPLFDEGTSSSTEFKLDHALPTVQNTNHIADVIIPSSIDPTETLTGYIDDIVVPPLVNTAVEHEVDSQSGVASST